MWSRSHKIGFLAVGVVFAAVIIVSALLLAGNKGAKPSKSHTAAPVVAPRPQPKPHVSAATRALAAGVAFGHWFNAQPPSRIMVYNVGRCLTNLPPGIYSCAFTLVDRLAPKRNGQVVARCVAFAWTAGKRAGHPDKKYVFVTRPQAVSPKNCQVAPPPNGAT